MDWLVNYVNNSLENILFPISFFAKNYTSTALNSQHTTATCGNYKQKKAFTITWSTVTRARA